MKFKQVNSFNIFSIKYFFFFSLFSNIKKIHLYSLHKHKSLLDFTLLHARQAHGRA
jgi:hypothetical protein